MTTKPTTGHPCASVLCTETVPTDKFACRRHWHALPGDLRKQLGAAYRQYQRDPRRYAKKYAAARAAALDYLNGGL